MPNVLLRQQKKINIIFLCVMIMFVLLVTRIIYIQVFRKDYYTNKAYGQQTREREVEAKRGTIYDSTYSKVLAQSISTSKLSINPTIIENKEEVAKNISEILDINSDEVLNKLKKTTASQTIHTKIDNEKTSKLLKYIADNDIDGIKVDEDTTRVYPYDNMLSHVLGFVGKDNQGLSGIEAMYEAALKGTSGKIVGSTDNRGNETPFTEEQYVSPIDGKDLILTVDATIQSILEKYAVKAHKENNAEYVMGVVMNPNTGAILGMVTTPTFNPNEPFTPNTEELIASFPSMEASQKSEALNQMWRNRVISDTEEPGSTWKIITAASALEEGAVELDGPKTFNCRGSVKVGSWTIKCWKHPRSHGSETLREGIINSCNPVFIEASKRVGIENYMKYVDAFGFKYKSGIDLPGEAGGILHNSANMTEIDLATISFGQSIQVSTLQTAIAYSAIANGGNLVEPYIVKEIRNNDGSVYSSTQTNIVKQVFSESTASQVLSALKDTVEIGTGKSAKVNGYSVAGKTATAEQGRGENKKYMAGFAGIAPANNPELVVVLNVYNPTTNGHSGSTVSAPVVGSIIEEILRYMDIKPEYTFGDREYKEKMVPNLIGKTVAEATNILYENGFGMGYDYELKPEDIVVDQIPKYGASVIENSSVRLYTNTDEKQTATIPSLINKKSETAIKQLTKLGFNVKVIGNGYVLTQEPSSGSVSQKGSIVTIKCVDTLELP